MNDIIIVRKVRSKHSQKVQAWIPRGKAKKVENTSEAGNEHRNEENDHTRRRKSILWQTSSHVAPRYLGASAVLQERLIVTDENWKYSSVLPRQASETAVQVCGGVFGSVHDTKRSLRDFFTTVDVKDLGRIARMVSTVFKPCFILLRQKIWNQLSFLRIKAGMVPAEGTLPGKGPKSSIACKWCLIDMRMLQTFRDRCWMCKHGKHRPWGNSCRQCLTWWFLPFLERRH